MRDNGSNNSRAAIFVKSCINALTHLASSKLLEKAWLVLFMIYTGIPLIRSFVDSFFLIHFVPLYRPYTTVIFVGFFGLAVLRRLRSKLGAQ